MITKKTKAFIITIVAIIGVVFGNLVAFCATRSDFPHKFLYGFDPVPTYVYCSSEFSNQTLTAIHNACLTWNNAGAGNLVYRSTTPHNITTHPYLNNRNDITKKNRGQDGRIMETYATQTGYSCITEADIIFNTYYPFGTASTSYDTRSAVTHELGHLLGLGHLPVGDYVMSPTISTGIERHVLRSLDISSLITIYGEN